LFQLNAIVGNNIPNLDSQSGPGVFI